MAGTARRASYKDTLQPALHRRFTSSATLLLAVSYLEAVFLASWRSSYFWSWFPIGPTGVRTAFIFLAGLLILVLRIAHYHVGLKTDNSALQTLAGAVLSLRAYETAFWYSLSSLLFCLVFLFSQAASANLGWITYFSGDRARLNERPLFLAWYLVFCALMRTAYHYHDDTDRLDLSRSKRQAGEQARKLGVLPPSLEAVLARLPIVLHRDLLLCAVAIAFAIPVYFCFVRSLAWGWALALLRPFYNLPRTSMPPSTWPLDVYLLWRCVVAGTLVSFVWSAGNEAFSILMVKEPLKNGKPLTSDSKDPNGSLLNGLKSKKLSIQSFAMWELAIIARDFDERRRAIYSDIDRKDGPMWAQVYAICMGLLKSMEARVDGYGKPTAAAAAAAAAAEAAAEAPRQRVLAPLRDEAIVSKKGSQASGLVERAFDQLARAPGSSPASELSPLAKRTWKAAKDRVLSKEQQEALSPGHVRGELDQWAARFTRLAPLKALLRHGFRARLAAATLGTPYAEATLYAHAAEALCRLAVRSLDEDQFGNVHRDVAAMVRALTALIGKVAALKARFPLHWSDAGGARRAPEVDEVLEALRAGLGEVVARFAPYSGDLGLSLTDLRLAREAAAAPAEAGEGEGREAGGRGGRGRAATTTTTTTTTTAASKKKTETRAARRSERARTGPEMEQVR